MSDKIESGFELFLSFMAGVAIGMVVMGWIK